MWTCPKCETKVDPSFDVCWNCGTSADGVVDPDFVKADDAGPIEASDVVPRLDVAEDVKVLTDLPTPLSSGLVEAYQALDLMEATFITTQLSQAGIQAVSDTHDLRESLGTMEGGPKVWVRAEDLERARTWLETYDRDKVVPQRRPVDLKWHDFLP